MKQSIDQQLDRLESMLDQELAKVTPDLNLINLLLRDIGRLEKRAKL